MVSWTPRAGEEWPTGMDNSTRVLPEEKIIDIPRITEDEIKGRSKGEPFSKAIIILQTTWFIVQCVARWSQGLAVTELEVVTLGFAVLNGLTYGLWWHKPQNVNQPIYLELRKKADEMETFKEGWKRTDTESTIVSDSHSDEATVRAPRRNIALRAFWYLWKGPSRFCQALLHPLFKMSGSTTANIVHPGNLRVPMFYSDPVSLLEVWGPTAAIGITFGSIHLIASWFLAFPSRREMVLWRACATVITVQPLMLGLGGLLVVAEWGRMKAVLGVLSGVVGLPVYIGACMVLLSLPFLSLRTLPPGAFQTVHWTSFIPHI